MSDDDDTDVLDFRKRSPAKGSAAGKLGDIDADAIIPADYWVGKSNLKRPPGCPPNPDSKLLDQVLFEITERDQILTDAILEVKRDQAQEDDSGIRYTKATIQRLIYKLGIAKLCEELNISVDEELSKARKEFGTYYKKQKLAVDSYIAQRKLRNK